MTDVTTRTQRIANPAVAISDSDLVIVRQGVQTQDSIALASDFKTYVGGKFTAGFSAVPPIIGQQGSYFVATMAGTITAWNIVVDTGTATVKVWKIATGTAAPTSANSINTSGVSISTGTAIRSTTLSDFTTTTVTANDIFGFEITAVSGATRIDFQLEITR